MDFKPQIVELEEVVYSDEAASEVKGKAILNFGRYVNDKIKPKEPTIAGYIGKVLAVIAITLAVAIVTAAIGIFIAAGAPLTLPALGAAFTGFAVGLVTCAKTSLIIAGASAGAAVIAGSASGLGIFGRKPDVERGTVAATQSTINGLHGAYSQWVKLAEEPPTSNEDDHDSVSPLTTSHSN